jgi:DNA-binding LytR/AlgR family response regulator
MKTQNLTTQIAIGGRQKVCPDEVIMLKADVNYTTVHLISGQSLIVATTLKKLEERFSAFSFVRMNKTYMVNVHFIIEEQENALKMSNLQTIIFSRRRGKAWKLGLVG